MGHPVGNLVVDFESLGVSRDSILLSCGLLLVDEDYEIIQEHSLNFDIKAQIFNGRTVDPDTVAWWKRIDDAYFDELLDGEEPLFTLACILGDMDYNYYIKEVWSRGHIDFQWLTDVYEIDYWKARDCRTLDSLQKMETRNNHNALQDCKNQLEHIREVMKKWKSVQSVEENS